MQNNTHFSKKNKDYEAYWKDRIGRNRTYITPIHRKILELVSKIAKPGSAVLDLGVGPGHVFRELQKDYKVYGAEISTTVFDLYDFPTENIKHVDLEKEMPAFDGNPNFSVIIASHIIHHFDDPLAFLRRVKEKMDSNTRLLVATPNTVFINYRIKYLLLAQFPDLSRAHVNYLTPREYRKLFEEAGLEIETFAGIKHYPLLVLSTIFPSLFSQTLFFVVKKV
ncbi:MAG: hypothetical protein AMXMBFR44_1130 [Candidatus Campbellbacteria bacterium]